MQLVLVFVGILSLRDLSKSRRDVLKMFWSRTESCGSRGLKQDSTIRGTQRNKIGLQVCRVGSLVSLSPVSGQKLATRKAFGRNGQSRSVTDNKCYVCMS